jgi:endonuclease YncB( thermonuclease family)
MNRLGPVLALLIHWCCVGAVEIGPCLVLDIQDGDTVLLEVNGKRESVSAMAIDAPAARDGVNDVAMVPQGEQAWDFARTVLPAGSSVWLWSSDETLPRDMQGRFRAVIVLGKDSPLTLQEMMIRAGWSVYIKSNGLVGDETLNSRLEKAELFAWTERRGLWSSNPLWADAKRRQRKLSEQEDRQEKAAKEKAEDSWLAVFGGPMARQTELMEAYTRHRTEGKSLTEAYSAALAEVKSDPLREPIKDAPTPISGADRDAQLEKKKEEEQAAYERQRRDLAQQSKARQKILEKIESDYRNAASRYDSLIRINQAMRDQITPKGTPSAEKAMSLSYQRDREALAEFQQAKDRYVALRKQMGLE